MANILEEQVDLAGKFLVVRGLHPRDSIDAKDVQSLLAEFKLLSKRDIEHDFRKWEDFLKWKNKISRGVKV